MNLIIVALIWIVFSIATYGHVTPSGGSREKPLRLGDRVTITWDSSRVTSPVVISLWDGHRRRTTRIHTSSASSQAFEWEIPDSLQPGSLYRFIVASSSSPMNGHYSEGFVTIYPPEQRTSSVSVPIPDQQLHVTPIPAHDVVRVRWGDHEARTIGLTTLLGATIASWACSTSSTQMDISVSAIPSGVYQLTLQYANGATTTRTVVIQH